MHSFCRQWDHTHLGPPQPGAVGYFSDGLCVRAEHVVNGTNLVEAILYSHLLLEHALDLRLQARFRQPAALENPNLARLTFAQKVTVYTGLYDPEQEQIALLQAMNRLRNRMAHTLGDPEKLTMECLPDKFVTSLLLPPGRAMTPLGRVQDVFLNLTYWKLQVVFEVSGLVDDPEELKKAGLRPGQLLYKSREA